MNDPNSAIPDHVRPAVWERYEAWRVRRYEQSQARNAHRLTRLRNRRGARLLAGGVVMSLIVLVVATVMSFLTFTWFFIPFILGLIGTVVFLKMLGTVTGNVAEAPVSALDELQLAKRNSARSIGYIAVFGLMFAPYLALVAIGSALDSVSGHTVYALGVMMITLLLIGTCSPTLLLAWWSDDPDPEDFVENAGSIAAAAEPASSAPIPDAPDAADATRNDATAHLDPPAPAPW